MGNLKEQFIAFTEEVKPLCYCIDVREDENGPYVFALGLRETHTLQMRKVKSKYVLELWYGKTAEVETIVEEPEYSNLNDAFYRAKTWLEQDAI